MPSIPQSLLWISLVVLWLFVLVPMLINRRDTVRRTSDVALSTRVLNSRTSRLLRRTGPAAGHRHDPDWRRDDSDLDDEFREYEAEDYAENYEEAVADAVQEARVRSHSQSMMVVALDSSVSEATTEPVYLDVDVVEETSGALPVGTGVQQALFEESASEELAAEQAATLTETATESVPEPEPVAEVGEPVVAAEPAAPAEASADEPEPADDEYEYIDDTSGLEEGDEPQTEVTPRVSRRRRLDSSSTAAAVSARKFRFRKRMITVMAAAMVLTAVLSFTVDPGLWWICGGVATITVTYLAYLRRQTRIEAQVRRRRQQRMARSRPEGRERFGEGFAAEPRMDRDVDGVSTRLQRPGAVVLDIDDEDPVFEHLDEMPYSRRYDLPRAAGQ